MNIDWTSLGKRALKIVSDNGPAILTGLGAIGVVTTAIFAAKAGVATVSTLAEAEEEKGAPLTKVEKIAATWTLYIPPVIIGATAVVCIIASHSIDAKRQAAAIGMFTLSETAVQEYRDKTKEVTNPTKEKKIRDEIAQDRVKADPVSGKEIVERKIGGEVVVSRPGTVLCRDSLSGRYFEADMETLRKAENNINARLIRDDYCSQNEFYREIGLPDIGFGDEFGWTSEKLLELEYSTVLSEDGRPCISIDYHMLPIRGFHRFG